MGFASHNIVYIAFKQGVYYRRIIVGSYIKGEKCLSGRDGAGKAFFYNDYTGEYRKSSIEKIFR